MSTPVDVPPLVSRALQNSLETGWVQTTRNESGRLLATLAASRTGTVAEAATGSGAGVAWLRSGAPEGTRVVCVETSAERAERARATLSGSDVEVLDGGCEELRRRAPFSLLYMSKRVAQEAGRDLAHSLVEPGGMVVVDDFFPSQQWPPCDETGQVDQLRQGWLLDERFTSQEVSVAPDVSLVIAVRR